MFPLLSICVSVVIVVPRATLYTQLYTQTQGITLHRVIMYTKVMSRDLKFPQLYILYSYICLFVCLLIFMSHETVIVIKVWM
jgi:hypothetical protein